MGYPSDTDLILVCVMPNCRDLEIARILGWYRIPLRTAPKIIQVDYLAFYQTSAFGKEERWQIQYFAPVLGHELLRRVDLFRDQPEHPHAQEEYFKISIGALSPLYTPIKAEKWKRLTFLYTTGAHLLRAATLSELVVRNEERTILWRTLRERAEEGFKKVDENYSLQLDDQMKAFLGMFREDESSYTIN